MYTNNFANEGKSFVQALLESASINAPIRIVQDGEGVFQGLIQELSQDLKTLIIKDVYAVDEAGGTGINLPIARFDVEDISRVYLLEESDLSDPERNNCTRVMKPHVKPVHLQNQFTATDLEIVRESRNAPVVLPTHVSYQVIDDVAGDKFAKAIAELSSENVLSLAGEGVSVSRFGQLCWLSVCSGKQVDAAHFAKQRVFCFDILKMGAEAFSASSGLKLLLESTNILKICHDSRFLADCLFHKFDVSLRNIWDTQVAHVYSEKTETGYFPRYLVSLQYLLAECLKIKLPTYFQRKNLAEIDQKFWTERPLAPNHCRFLAAKVCYLADLRRCLMNAMLQDYSHSVGLFLSVRDTASDEEIQEMLFNEDQSHAGFVQRKDEAEERRRRKYPNRNSADVDKNTGFRENVSKPIESKIRYSRDVWHRIGRRGTDGAILEEPELILAFGKGVPKEGEVSPLDREVNNNTVFSAVDDVTLGTDTSFSSCTSDLCNLSLGSSDSSPAKTAAVKRKPGIGRGPPCE